MKRKDRKKKGGQENEDPVESESTKLQREIDEAIAEMESGVDRLRQKFRRMQEQLSDLHKHLYPDSEDEQSESIVRSPDSSDNALLA